MKHISLLFILLISIGLNAQTLTSVYPNSGNAGQSLYVTVSGQNTSFLQGSNTVWFQMGTQTYFDMSYPVANSNTSLSGNVYIPNYAPAGDYNVTVYNNTNGTMTLPGAFTVFHQYPHIVDVAPNQAQQSQYLTVNVTTQNAHFWAGTNTQVYFTQGSYTIMGTNTQIMGQNAIRTDVAVPLTAPVGLYHTFAYNNYDGTMNKLNSFTVNTNSPIVDTNFIVAPNVAQIGSEIDVFVEYPNFYSSIPNPLVSCFLAKGSQMIPVINANDTGFVNTFGFYGHVDLPYDPYVSCYDVVVTDIMGLVYRIPCAIQMVNNSMPRIDSIVPDRYNDKVDVYGTNTSFTYAGLSVELFQGMDYLIIKKQKGYFPFPYDSVNVMDDTHLEIYSQAFFPYTKYMMLAPLWAEIKDNPSGGKLSYPFVVDSPGKITTSSSSAKINAFPNPTTGSVVLDMEDRNEAVTIGVYSFTGKLLKTVQFDPMEKIEIDLQDYERGTYLLYVKGQKTTGSTVVIKSE